MRKALAILSIIVLGVLLYIYLDQFYEHKTLDLDSEQSVLTESQIIDDILEGDAALVEKVKSLQENAQSISNFNSTVTKVIYSNDLTDEELMKVVKFQYNYFDEELKVENSVNQMYTKLKSELSDFETYGLKIIGYDSVSPEYIADDKYMSIVKVKYYTNYPDEEGNIYMGYVFKMDQDNLWNLYGFKRIDEFPIVK